MPLLKLRTHGPAGVLTALESLVLQVTGERGAEGITPSGFPGRGWWVDEIHRDAARRALSALWRRGLLTRVGWGDTAVYRRRP